MSTDYFKWIGIGIVAWIILREMNIGGVLGTFQDATRSQYNVTMPREVVATDRSRGANVRILSGVK